MATTTTFHYGSSGSYISIVNDIIAFLLDAGSGLTGRPINEINYEVHYKYSFIPGFICSISASSSYCVQGLAIGQHPHDVAPHDTIAIWQLICFFFRRFGEKMT